MSDNPNLTPIRQPDDADAAQRPKTLAEFVGQAAAKDNLRVFIESARSRRDRALSMNTRKLSLAAACPTNSASVLGRNAASASSGWRMGVRLGLSLILQPSGGRCGQDH